VTITRMERDAMIPLPAIENRFLCVSVHGNKLDGMEIGYGEFLLL